MDLIWKRGEEKDDGRNLRAVIIKQIDGRISSKEEFDVDRDSAERGDMEK
jgi:hypothetical protein